MVRFSPFIPDIYNINYKKQINPAKLDFFFSCLFAREEPESDGGVCHLGALVELEDLGVQLEEEEEGENEANAN